MGGAAFAVAELNGEGLRTVLVRDVGEAHVGLRVFAVGEDAAVDQLADQRLHHRMIGAHHREAVERDVLDEIVEGVLHRFVGVEVVEVLGIDIGDDGDVGRQLEEGAVGLVGLHHHPVAGTEPGIGAVGVDDAAVDDGRVEIAAVEQRRHHRGGGGLAVGAGDGDAGLSSRISSASISARRTTGSRLARAAISSGLSRLMAEETTTTSAPSMFSALWPISTRMPMSRRRLTLALSATSEPVTV